jgi:hypothetical protein
LICVEEFEMERLTRLTSCTNEQGRDDFRYEHSLVVRDEAETLCRQIDPGTIIKLAYSYEV